MVTPKKNIFSVKIRHIDSGFHGNLENNQEG